MDDESKGRVLAVLPAGATATSRSSSTARRSTRSPAVRSATPDRSAPTPASRRCSTRRSRFPGLRRHVARVVEGEINPGQEAVAAIDVERRDAIRRNHTGTHLLHWALREVLGPHVKQAGSLVAPDRLRFDFSHYSAVTPEEIEQIEDLANHEVLANDRVRAYETTKGEAEAAGAIAFFGDKYGDVVRVLEAGQALARAVRRHARARRSATSVPSRSYPKARSARTSAASRRSRELRRSNGSATTSTCSTRPPRCSASSPISSSRASTRRLDEVKALRDEIKALRQQQAGGDATELATEAVDGIVIARRDGTSRDELRELALAVRQQPGIRAVVLVGAPEGGGAALVSAVANGSGLHAERADRRRREDRARWRGQERRRRGRRRKGPEQARRSPPAGTGGGRAGMRVLALDLGSKRIGVAVSDPSETIASPDRVLERTGSRARDHKAIGELVAEWEAELVVVGLPLSLSGDDGPAARATREEVAELARDLTVPVELHDERLTTVTASRTLQEAKMTADARRRVVDKVAAAVLLQSWLDERASRRRRDSTETGMTSDG